MAEQLLNLPAAATTLDAAIRVAAQQDSCCAQVIRCNLINLFTLSSIGNYGQAEHISLLGKELYADLDKIKIGATQFTGDVAFQLKSPPN